MNQCIEIIRCHDEAIAAADIAPPPHHDIPTQGMLQRSRQMLVENRVQVVVVRTGILFQLTLKPSVGVIDALRVVVPEVSNNNVRSGQNRSRSRQRAKYCALDIVED